MKFFHFGYRVVNQLKPSEIFPFITLSRFSQTVRKAFLVLLFAVGYSDTLCAQKTSTWTGEGSDDNWTTTENWDTAEDPQGGDTAIVPSPFEIALDADRSVSLLDLRGTTGNFISISGSAMLTVQNGLLWKDSVLVGSGTLTSNNNSVFQEVASFNSWTVNLGGTTTVSSGYLSTSNVVNLSGTVSFGTADLTGSGTFNLTGDLTKNTADANHSSFFNPITLNVEGSITATKGIIVVNSGTLENTSSTVYSAGAEGRLRLLADDTTYEGVTFSNFGEMDITDDILGTPGSIKFRGTNNSDGSNPVVLGQNSTFDADTAAFEGLWEMKAAALKGKVRFNGGGFTWQNGEINPGVENLGGDPGDFVIEASGNPAPAIKGVFDNKGYVVQRSTLSINEGIEGTTTIVDGDLNLFSGSTWEMQGAVSLNEGVSTTGNSPKIDVKDGATLLHSATSSSDQAFLNIGTSVSGTVKNTGGRLTFEGGNGFVGTQFTILNDDGLDSEIRLSGTSTVLGMVTFSAGGVLDFRENWTLIRGLSGQGQGRAKVSDGTVVFLADFIGQKVELDFSGGSNGAVFEVSREDGFSPDIAVKLDIESQFTSTRYGYVINKGNFEWSGRTIGSESVPDEHNIKNTALENQSDTFKILPGSPLKFQNCYFYNKSLVNFGEGGSPTLTLQGAMIQNSGTFDFQGDGDITVSGSSSLSGFVNESSGVLRKSSGSSTSFISARFDNQGTVEALSGTLSLSGTITQYDSDNKRLTGGKWIAADGAVLRFGNIGTINEIGPPDATSTEPPPAPGEEPKVKVEVKGSDSQFQNQSSSDLFSGDLTLFSATVITVTDDGEVTIGDELFLSGGTLSGDGVIYSTVVIVEDNGTISPGQSPGTLDIVGDVQFQSGSRYLFEASSTAHDMIQVDGDVTLGGQFAPVFLDGYVPTLGESFTVLTATSITGSFDGQYLEYVDGDYRFSFNNTGTALIATVESTDYTNFGSWQQEHFLDSELADDSISGRNADPDNDGIENLFEFVFGLQPKAADPYFTFPEITPADGTDSATVQVDFSWRASIISENFRFEYSDDLEVWHEAPAQILSDVTVDGFREITVEIEGNGADTSDQFFRMVVESVSP